MQDKQGSSSSSSFSNNNNNNSMLSSYDEDTQGLQERHEKQTRLYKSTSCRLVNGHHTSLDDRINGSPSYSSHCSTLSPLP